MKCGQDWCSRKRVKREEGKGKDSEETRNRKGQKQKREQSGERQRSHLIFSLFGSYREKVIQSISVKRP